MKVFGSKDQRVPNVSKHLYRKISLDQVWGYVSNFQMSENFQV
jgi:hypothetical protein